MVLAFGAFVSALLGWLYFAAWSGSFYPQAILNYKRKSVRGLSVDFLVYNAFGFLCYAIYNLTFYASPRVRHEYEERNDGQPNLVQLNDVVFAVHAFLISSITLGQAFVYSGDVHQRLSLAARGFLFISGVGIAALLVGVNFGATQWIDVMYFLSYVKLFVTVVKYCPQAYLNYQKQSTVGWSIHNILLDFSGGVLSLAQLLVDAGRLHNWEGVLGNPVKLGLGLFSIGFDVLFMLQHYVFYRHTSEFQRLDDDGDDSDSLDDADFDDALSNYRVERTA
ncbi:hypothetical protein IWQ60_010971 [Tieghemiomyces parasiticus]|uniref:Cystinosin n=1 Tax=Tieghemiomyces parasiticus TaxID=78921 RepID=A0A9W7ZP87_9FUNG|nr:hypothetical protein IWQ60_010971 [Tieghemiomyces parasiticus]